jgi:hypothetical protein
MPFWSASLPAALVLAARGSEGGDHFVRVLFVLTLLGAIGLGVLAWQQAQRIERNTAHLRKLLGQVKALHSVLPVLANWARMTRDRRAAYRERKAEAAEAGASDRDLLRIAEEAIEDMDMGEFAKTVDDLFAEVGFRPPPLPSKPDAEGTSQDEDAPLSLD